MNTQTNAQTNNLREAITAAIDALEDAANEAAARRDWFPVTSEYHRKNKMQTENARRHMQTLQRFLAEKSK